ncbi:MAG: YdeI/OmpD-associated family protein [Myxococcaceae bacterium]
MSAPTFFATPAHFRAWLEKHHAVKTELLVGFYKTDSGKPSITWPESVDQALCFGWIDGVRRGVSAEAYTIRFTPRKPTSIWSAINVAKVEALTKAGLMREAGLAAYEKRKASRTAVYSFERFHAAKFTADQAAALKANAKAKKWFDAQAPSYQRQATHWVVSAKKEETREKRLQQLIKDCAAGRPIPPLKWAKPKSARRK